MHRALQAIAAAIRGTPFEGDLWLVGGAVRDELLGRPVDNDFDLVTRGSSADLAHLLRAMRIATIAPVVYPRFGTAMVEVEGAKIEIVTARRESYDADSRKPSVEPSTLEEDARRRDFTINTLLRELESGAIQDPLGMGLADLEARRLRTPLDPIATFHDDPLRMLRAVRFRWQLDFAPAPGLYEAVQTEASRLAIISFERIRDELLKMLALPAAASALEDLRRLGLLRQFAPELEGLVGVEQGSFHHLDVWDHTLLVVRNVGPGDPLLALAALFHDVAKPETRFIDADGATRFFGHEGQGAKTTERILRRLKFPQRDIDAVASLVKNHMRLGSAPEFTAAAARRLLRDLDDQVERLLSLVEADASALKPGVKQLDLAPIRARLAEVRLPKPREAWRSPLSGEAIMALLGIPAGPEVGKWKQALTDAVLDGRLSPGDAPTAQQMLLAWREEEREPNE